MGSWAERPARIRISKFRSHGRGRHIRRQMGQPTLASYLQDPKGLVKGTKMVFPGLKKDEDVANVIAYLKQFSP
ncbi:hypothetical protein AJ88_26615 [Mesorhizobium amorphae CCBAU 01583]|nr:hypothetical protein AJ88_26615 [Mesorhizobium amorphae CCBAU 01583]